MCNVSSLARERENMKCVLVTNAIWTRGEGRAGSVCSRKLLRKRVLKKGKEKTDEGSSVLLYFMTEEGERE